MSPPTPGTTNRVLLVRDVTGAADVPITVWWLSPPGTVYRLDTLNDLLRTNWLPLGIVTAISPMTSFADTNAIAPHRYYRLIELP